MFVFGYFRGGGKTIDLKNKVFGHVNHNHRYQRIKWFEVIHGDQEGFQGIFGRPGSSNWLFSAIIGVGGQLVELKGKIN